MDLKEYLRSRRITHKEFAKMIGVSQTSVTYYANKIRAPSLATCLKITEVTSKRVTLDDLLLSTK